MPAAAIPVRTSSRLAASTSSPISPKALQRKVAASLRRSDRLAINVLKRSLEEPISDANKPTAAAATVRRSKRLIEKVIKDYEKSPSTGKRQLKKVAMPQPSPAKLTPGKKEPNRIVDLKSSNSVQELPREQVKRAIEFPASPEPRSPVYALRTRGHTSRAVQRQ